MQKVSFYELQFASVITHALIWWVERDCTRGADVQALLTHRCAVLHHGVVEFMTLRCATREETTLANVIVEVLQTAISAKRERKLTINMIGHHCMEKQHELFFTTDPFRFYTGKHWQNFLDSFYPLTLKQPFCSSVKLLSTCYWNCLKLTVFLRRFIHSSHVALDSITSLPHSLEVFLFHRFLHINVNWVWRKTAHCVLFVFGFFWSLQ